jgi:hypothetical protein
VLARHALMLGNLRPRLGTGQAVEGDHPACRKHSEALSSCRSGWDKVLRCAGGDELCCSGRRLPCFTYKEDAVRGADCTCALSMGWYTEPSRDCADRGLSGCWRVWMSRPCVRCIASSRVLESSKKTATACSMCWLSNSRDPQLVTRPCDCRSWIHPSLLALARSHSSCTLAS